MATWCAPLTLRSYIEELQLTRSILLQVDIANESHKAGFKPYFIRDFFHTHSYKAFPRLKIQGFMAMGPFVDDKKVIYESFLSLKDLLNECKLQHSGLKVLSMGMSHDFEEAIRAGSTMIRVGTAIFGDRVIK